MEKEVRQLRLLLDEVRRGVAAYGIPPGSGSRTSADGEGSAVGFLWLLALFTTVNCGRS